MIFFQRLRNRFCGLGLDQNVRVGRRRQVGYKLPSRDAHEATRR